MSTCSRSFSRQWALLLGFAWALVASAGGDARAGAAGRGEAPPPIPSAAQREAFVLAHGPAPGEPGIAHPWEGEGGRLRAVHDEYDVAHYDVDLSLDIGAHVLSGVVRVEATVGTASLTSIRLDFFAPMVVDEVVMNGGPVPFSHAGSLLTVTLDRTYLPGEAFAVTCAYHGTPSYSGNPFRWNLHGAGVPMVLSYSEPFAAPAWWVCKDDPKDKATFGIHVTAPDTLFTVSNGRLDSVEPHPDGTATCHWIHDYPMSPYLFSIATTNYDKWSEVYTSLDGQTTMPVDYYVYPEDLADAQVDWSRNVEMMEYYAGLFGEYPFLTEKYALAEFHHAGAMEHQTATSMGNGWITGDHANDFVVAHELSHMWVGDMITMRLWSHAWTKEGFATYCEALWFEDRYGEAYFHDYMAGMNVLNYAGYRLYNISPPLHSAIYYKGAWVLHMLRHVIGDAAFFAGVLGYTSDPDLRYGSSDTEDLRAAFEAASGEDLGWFFDEWIYEPGYPRYVPVWTSTPAGDGYDVRLQIAQVQTTGPVFKMPVDVLVETDAGIDRFVVWDSLRTQAFTLHVTSPPLEVTLDPDGWIIHVIDAGAGVDGDGDGGGDGLPGDALAAGGGLRIVPNPSRGPAVLRYALPGSGTARIAIFDAAGRRVRLLLDSGRASGPGGLLWDGRGEDGLPLPTGIYHHRVERDGAVVTGRQVLLRE